MATTNIETIPVDTYETNSETTSKITDSITASETTMEWVALLSTITKEREGMIERKGKH